MPKNPLGEVFGYPVGDMSSEAVSYRHGRLCPFHNSSGMNCTKSSAIDPIGVCTVLEGNRLVATCPIRFREHLLILSDAAGFFFPHTRYVAVTEARLRTGEGKPAGNVDIVIAALNEHGEVIDFGAVEVQAVYITGNVKNAFKKYMEDPAANHGMEWPNRNYPSPDYLSSSRKRLAPQLIYKGGILHSWGRRLAVVVDEAFFSQLPTLAEVSKGKAEIAWMVYGFQYDRRDNRYRLERKTVKYTEFESALAAITTPPSGDMHQFTEYLERRIREGKTMAPPDSTELAPEVEPLPDVFDARA